MKLAPIAALISVSICASGCATFLPVPKDYTGPTAVLADSGLAEDGSKAQLFAAVEIDGNGIRNAFRASAEASQGRGNSLTPIFSDRHVKASPMRVTLRCSHATGAPIAAIASQMAGTFFSVEGVVDFNPVPNGVYVVKGELKKERSSCWIEDNATGKPVTTVIAK